MNVESLYTKVRALFDGNTNLASDPSAWIAVIAALMRLVRRWRRPGADKKAMVLTVLELIIERDVPADHQAAARATVEGLSHGIDLAVRYQAWKFPQITCCRK